MIQTFFPEKYIRNYNYKQQNQASKNHQEIHPHFDELLHIVHVIINTSKTKPQIYITTFKTSLVPMAKATTKPCNISHRHPEPVQAPRPGISLQAEARLQHRAPLVAKPGNRIPVHRACPLPLRPLPRCTEGPGLSFRGLRVSHVTRVVPAATHTAPRAVTLGRCEGSPFAAAINRRRVVVLRAVDGSVERALIHV